MKVLNVKVKQILMSNFGTHCTIPEIGSQCVGNTETTNATCDGNELD